MRAQDGVTRLSLRAWADNKEQGVAEEKKNINIEADDRSTEPSESAEENGNSSEIADKLEGDIETIRQEAEDTRDQLLRLAAEFENYKKRMEREKETLVKYAGEQILRELLTTVDNLDRAIEQGSADSDNAEKQLAALLEGVGLTRKGLLATLEKFDVVPLETVGGPFDPNEQEAMSMEPSTKVPANNVLREFAKGYRFKDRLLRAAKVVVSAGG